MMENFIRKYYPILINIYTIWILYMMFFAYERNDGLAIPYEINPLPFESIQSLFEKNTLFDACKNFLGNIILFCPYGFLPILYPRLNNYFKVFLVFFIIINFMEFQQYFFKRGFAEIDDVILNTFGMTLGYMAYKQIFKNKSQLN